LARALGGTPLHSLSVMTTGKSQLVTEPKVPCRALMWHQLELSTHNLVPDFQTHPTAAPEALPLSEGVHRLYAPAQPRVVPGGGF